MLTPLKPVSTVRLIAPLARRLIALLRALTPEQWAASTCYPNWNVRDIASHLLQTGIGRLSLQRDGAPAPPAGGPVSFEAVARLVAGLNARWEKSAAAFSPRLVTELAAVTEPALARFFRTLDPAGPAFYAVSWAGEHRSQTWFDVAREYTERWHHQEQIREAVGAPPLTGRRWLAPVLETLMRAAPFWYAAEPAATGTEVVIAVSGPVGGEWTLRRGNEDWRLFKGLSGKPAAARVELAADIAWKFLTRSITGEKAQPLIGFEGDRALGERFLSVKAIMMED